MTTSQTQFRIHPKQREVYNSNARYKIVDCGRRWGKTELAWIECLLYMLQTPKCLVWWVAPIYKELIPATKKVRDLTPKEYITKKIELNETIRYIRLINGSECFFHSADREDSLRGSGLHGLVIDEAGMLKEQRWTAELQPSLMDYDGWVIFIGTPKGTNWFSKIFSKGQDPHNKDYKSWKFSSYYNTTEQGGFLKKSSIDKIANDLPERIKRQEIYAEFLEGEGVVFRNIANLIRDNIKPYQKDEQILVGTDYGKTVDFTAHVAIRPNGEIVDFDRYGKIDWHFQRQRTKNFCSKFGTPHLLIDSTGLGDPIYDELKREYLRVSGYKITNTTKKALIENLAMMMDNNRIFFPGDPKTRQFSPQLKVLQSELEIFTYNITPSGNTQYSAPEGYHDDCVVALALAAWQIRKPSQITVSRRKVPW